VRAERIQTVALACWTALSVCTAPLQAEASTLCADGRGVQTLAMTEKAHPPRKSPSSEAETRLNQNRFRFAASLGTTKVNHDEAYNALLTWAKAAPHRKRTLVHFDYHSDLYRNDSHLHAPPNIGNFINFLIFKGIIDEILWILPDHTRSPAAVPSEWGCATIKSQNELYWGRPNVTMDWQFRDGPPDQTICVAPSGHFTFKRLTDHCDRLERAVPVRKRTLGDILIAPERQLEGEIILDVDLDFFDHSGLYANEHPINKAKNIGPSPHCYSLHYSPSRLQEELSRFMRAITETMDLRPAYVFVSLSPGYATQNTKSLQEFFEKLIGLTQKIE